MSELRLRDHSQPCVHGFKCSHSWNTPKPGNPPMGFQRYNRGGGDRWQDSHFCDGGREIVWACGHYVDDANDETCGRLGLFRHEWRRRDDLPYFYCAEHKCEECEPVEELLP